VWTNADGAPHGHAHGSDERVEHGRRRLAGSHDVDMRGPVQPAGDIALLERSSQQTPGVDTGDGSLNEEREVMSESGRG
jgi:hypothetical protein